MALSKTPNKISLIVKNCSVTSHWWSQVVLVNLGTHSIYLLFLIFLFFLFVTIDFFSYVYLYHMHTGGYALVFIHPLWLKNWSVRIGRKAIECFPKCKQKWVISKFVEATSFVVSRNYADYNYSFFINFFCLFFWGRGCNGEILTLCWYKHQVVWCAACC